MFSGLPTYRRYRTLQLMTPPQHGEDVYALQTALNNTGFPCGPEDGIYGSQTAGAVKKAQSALKLVVDGKPGTLTQRALSLRLAERITQAMNVPLNAFKGQLELESGYWLGNYSDLRPDGTFDAGVAQRNTKFTAPQKGFNADDSIAALGSTIRTHYALFHGLATSKRRWSLAQGAWNAPAFACYIAREEGATEVKVSMTLRPSEPQRTTFEAYVRHASIYL